MCQKLCQHCKYESQGISKPPGLGLGSTLKKSFKLMTCIYIFQPFQEKNKNKTQDLFRVRLNVLDYQDCRSTLKISKLPNNTKERSLIFSETCV